MGNCSDELPFASDYLSDLSALYIAFFAIVGVLTLINLILYIESTVFFFTRLNYWKPRDKAKWLIAVYPIMCCTSFIGLLVPRSALLNDLAASSYLAVCIYLFVTMLVGHFGGAEKMVKRLSGDLIPIRSPPFICCLCKPPEVTPKKLQLLQAAILQFTGVRVLSSYVLAILWSDETYGSDNVFLNQSTYINLLVLISTLIAMWAFNIVYRLSKDRLQHTAVRPKFLCLQSVLFLTGIQRPVITIFVVAGVIECDPPLSAQANADRWHHIFMIIWMFIIFFFARKYYRRHVTNVPKEDLTDPERISKATHVTNTLAQQQTEDSGSNSEGGIRGIGNPCFGRTGTGPVDVGFSDIDAGDLDFDLGTQTMESTKVRGESVLSDDHVSCLDETKITLEMTK